MNFSTPNPLVSFAPHQQCQRPWERDIAKQICWHTEPACGAIVKAQSHVAVQRTWAFKLNRVDGSTPLQKAEGIPTNVKKANVKSKCLLDS